MQFTCLAVFVMGKSRKVPKSKYKSKLKKSNRAESRSSEPLVNKDDIEVNGDAVLERLNLFLDSYYNSPTAELGKITQCFCEDMKPIISYLCSEVQNIFQKEPLFIDVDSPLVIFGDIHGNLSDLYNIQKNFWVSGDSRFKHYKYIFLGDFVDRGFQSFEVILFLFIHKLVFPQNFVLIRGNHETRSVNRYYTFLEECKHKFGQEHGLGVWEGFNTVFD